MSFEKLDFNVLIFTNDNKHKTSYGLLRTDLINHHFI